LKPARRNKEQKEKKPVERQNRAYEEVGGQVKKGKKEYIFLRYADLHRRSNQRNFQSSFYDFLVGIECLVIKRKEASNWTPNSYQSR
jgi:hypothetical protein